MTYCKSDTLAQQLRILQEMPALNKATIHYVVQWTLKEAKDITMTKFLTIRTATQDLCLKVHSNLTILVSISNNWRFSSPGRDTRTVRQRITSAEIRAKDKLKAGLESCTWSVRASDGRSSIQWDAISTLRKPRSSSISGSSKVSAYFMPVMRWVMVEDTEPKTKKSETSESETDETTETEDDSA